MYTILFSICLLDVRLLALAHEMIHSHDLEQVGFPDAPVSSLRPWKHVSVFERGLCIKLL